MTKFFKGLIRDERGISALEYAILAGVIIVAVIAGATLFGGKIQGWFGSSVDAIDNAMPAATPPAN